MQQVAACSLRAPSPVGPVCPQVDLSWGLSGVFKPRADGATALDRVRQELQGCVFLGSRDALGACCYSCGSSASPGWAAVVPAHSPACCCR